MKRRDSFVTNSSSSSFICVLAEVVDKEKFYASGLGECYTGAQLKEKHRWGLGADWAGPYISWSQINPEKEYFYWEAYGGAGDDDYDFAVLDDNGNCDYMNYDVDLSDFPEDEQMMFGCAIPENGLLEIEVGFGAGRNG